ncbi:MAG: RusA family crossover junction endodeoxyribonuclease [Oscillospiraceae bacterium]|nr:RusA family crossover junction endodeoxyribonuclease [Oscillospiraceae bacterium]
MTAKYKRILPSRAYMEYAEECARQLLAQRATNAGIDYPVNVACVYYMPTRRKVDLTNLNEAIHDILVQNYVLMDDNRDIIAFTDGSRVEYDKKNPRVEITITPVEGDYEQWAKRRDDQGGRPWQR